MYRMVRKCQFVTTAWTIGTMRVEDLDLNDHIPGTEFGIGGEHVKKANSCAKTMLYSEKARTTRLWRDKMLMLGAAQVEGKTGHEPRRRRRHRMTTTADLRLAAHNRAGGRGMVGASELPN